MHHIVADAWSMGVLVREVSALYEALSSGEPPALPELPAQYADYAQWQRQWLAGPVLDRQIEYWKRRLEGAPPAIDLPMDRRPPAEPSYRTGRRVLTIPAATAASLAALSRSEGATAYMVLLAAFDVLLSKWSGQDDIVVGTPVANRTRAETEGLIGFFVNMLVLRTDLSGEPSWRDIVRRVRAAALEAYVHQDVPFEMLLEKIRVPRAARRRPAYQVYFSLENAPVARLRLSDIRTARPASSPSLSRRRRTASPRYSSTTSSSSIPTRSTRSPATTSIS
jgi:Condensation domain